VSGADVAMASGAVRPAMTAYVGQTRSPALIAELESHGIGECVVTGELPPRRPSSFFHDPGAYRDWRAGRPFNVGRWDRDMRWMSQRGIVPDFVIVPDIVAGGLASLAWSAFWLPSVPAEFPAYLAVQDGMTEANVAPHLAQYQGVFVGGSLAWKLETSASWVRFAHANALRCHIGRVGPAARVRWARQINADSIDSCLPLRHREHLASFLTALDVEPSAAGAHTAERQSTAAQLDLFTDRDPVRGRSSAS
jgi:hypothetical protein